MMLGRKNKPAKLDVNYKSYLDGEIKLYDSVFKEEQCLEIIQDVKNKNYIFGEVDRDDVPPAGVVCDLEGSITDQYLKGFLEKNYKDEFIVTRSYCNLFAANEPAYYHQDESDYTLMFYASDHWDYDLGGETKFIVNTDQNPIGTNNGENALIISIPPVPNRIVVFNGSIPHCASSYRNFHRFTAVLKLSRK